MHLVIFDIDGTLIDSVKVDDQCFIQSFEELHNIDLSQADWNDFTHVTDSGLTTEIFRTHLARTPTENEVIELKSHFYQLLNQRIKEITEIKGAMKTLNTLIRHPEYAVAFATGGWKETAILKLTSIGFEIGETPLVSSNDHFSRLEITRIAIEKALTEKGLTAFDSVTYIGDGLWDFQSSMELGINFIGLDVQGNNTLLNAGATQVTNDLENLEQIRSWINKND